MIIKQYQIFLLNVTIKMKTEKEENNKEKTLKNKTIRIDR